MHKNNEGYADPTAGKAINGVRREEYQKYLEELHGIMESSVGKLSRLSISQERIDNRRHYASTNTV